MKKTAPIIAFVCMVFTLSGFAQSTPLQNPHHAEKDILDSNRKMEKAFIKNDFLRVASFYTDDAVLIGNKHEVKGREAVNAYWVKLKDRGVSWKLQNVQLEVYGNIAIQRGISSMKFLYNGKEHLSEVRFTLVWKKTDNKWRIKIDHYSLL